VAPVSRTGPSSPVTPARVPGPHGATTRLRGLDPLPLTRPRNRSPGARGTPESDEVRPIAAKARQVLAGSAPASARGGRAAGSRREGGQRPPSSTSRTGPASLHGGGRRGTPGPRPRPPSAGSSPAASRPGYFQSRRRPNRTGWERGPDRRTAARAAPVEVSRRPSLTKRAPWAAAATASSAARPGSNGPSPSATLTAGGRGWPGGRPGPRWLGEAKAPGSGP